MDNNVVLVGNLTRDIELKYSASGVTFGNVGLALNKRKRNDKGEWEDGETSFFNGTLFRELAENASSSLSKGNRVIVVGTLRQRSYQAGGEEGDENKRSAVEVIIDSIGPDLRWATCELTKTERKSAGADEAPPPAEEDF